MASVCGIDEAGRGPVIGPMVMAGVLVKEEDIPRLKAIGVKDSKLLSREKRESLFEKIKSIAKGFKITVMEPKEIDDALESDDLNLNWLEAHKSAEIINRLKPDKVIVDSPSNNCEAYTRYLRKLLDNPESLQLVCIHKADVKHPEVGAASILAKVTRDREMDRIQERYGNCGPGYMSNKITSRFLEENWEKHPEIFRHSWVSYKNHKNAKFQKSLADFGRSIESREGAGLSKENKKKLEALKGLDRQGYISVPLKSEHELIRMKGACTAILYKTGKVLVQGKAKDKGAVEKILKESIEKIL
ncbi:ribonuclease HII [Candidatus Woesearchaeota archaeon]|nr:ribonuclease HII [Candidatus Woesearchaeota archaeon]